MPVRVVSAPRAVTCAAVHGVPWTMRVLEPVDVVHGRIAGKRSFCRDTALLRGSSPGREAVLAREAVWV